MLAHLRPAPQFKHLQPIIPWQVFLVFDIGCVLKLTTIPAPNERTDYMRNQAASPVPLTNEELMAFSEAIQDPETRQAIITILEEAGLLPL
jgi:hypothetical protein